jgi:hypothetical protein
LFVAHLPEPSPGRAFQLPSFPASSFSCSFSFQGLHSPKTSYARKVARRASVKLRRSGEIIGRCYRLCARVTSRYRATRHVPSPSALSEVDDSSHFQRVHRGKLGVGIGSSSMSLPKIHVLALVKEGMYNLSPQLGLLEKNYRQKSTH